MDSIEQLAAQFGVKPTRSGDGAQVRIRCPVHGGKDANCVVKQDDKGWVAHCHSHNCDGKGIVAALGVDTRTARALPVAHVCSDWCGTYDRVDGKGTVRNHRREPKVFWRDPEGSHLTHVELVADDGGVVVVTEGEKDRAGVVAAGLTGCSFLGGANGVRRANFSRLAGRDVVLWPDNDLPGLKAMRDAAVKLAGIASSIRMVDVSGLPEKAGAWDVDVERRQSLVAGASAVEMPAPTAQFAGPAGVAKAMVESGRLLLTNDRLDWLVGTADGTLAVLESGRRGGIGCGVVQRMTAEINGGEVPLDRDVKETIFALREYQEIVPSTVQVVETSSLNQQPIVLMPEGLCRWGEFKTLSVADVFATRTTCDMAVQIATSEADVAWARAVIDHYGVDLLRRPAYLLLGPGKTIDVVRIPASNAGKSTWAAWLDRCLGKWCQVISAADVLLDKKFNLLNEALTRSRLIILDEADKLDSKPRQGRINALTDASIYVERKGIDAEMRNRTANVLLMGADWPAIELGQGGSNRVQWAVNLPGMREMPRGMRDWMLSEEGVAWYGGFLAREAREMWRTGDTGDTIATLAAANEFVGQAQSELYQVLVDVIEAGRDGDFISNADLRAAIKARDEPDSKAPTQQTIDREVARIAKKARKGASRNQRGYFGIRFSALPHDDAPAQVDAPTECLPGRHDWRYKSDGRRLCDTCGLEM